MLRIYPRAAPTYNPMDNVAVMEGNEVGRAIETEVICNKASWPYFLMGHTDLRISFRLYVMVPGGLLMDVGLWIAETWLDRQVC